MRAKGASDYFAKQITDLWEEIAGYKAELTQLRGEIKKKDELIEHVASITGDENNPMECWNTVNMMAYSLQQSKLTMHELNAQVELLRNGVELRKSYPANEPQSNYEMCMTNKGVQCWDDGVWLRPCVEASWDSDDHHKITWFIELEQFLTHEDKITE